MDFYDRDKSEIHPNTVIDCLIQSHQHMRISVIASTKYNNKTVSLQMEIPPFNETADVRNFLFDYLYEIKQHLKKAMYDLSPFKKDLDTIYNNLLTNMHSQNFDSRIHEHLGELPRPKGRSF